MYNDFQSPSRTVWKFTYTGKELAAAAKAKVAYYKSRENKLRDLLSVAMADRSKPVSSDSNKKMESQVLDAALQGEQCEVFLHEFERTPDREFSLSISDVVFFSLAGHKPYEQA